MTHINRLAANVFIAWTALCRADGATVPFEASGIARGTCSEATVNLEERAQRNAEFHAATRCGAEARRISFWQSRTWEETWSYAPESCMRRGLEAKAHFECVSPR